MAAEALKPGDPGYAYVMDELADPTDPRLLNLVEIGSYYTARARMGIEDPTDPGEQPQRDIAQVLGSFICADCFAELAPGDSCVHMFIGIDGSRRIID
jgi:hypothetical protein